MTVDDALDGHRRPDADRRRRRGAGALRRSRRIRPSTKSIPARDEFEIALIAEARQRELPIFAICRGIQVLNVACGGTLVQDIPSQLTGALEHSFTVPPHQPFALAHEVWIEKDSLLARLMRERLSDADSCEVNSRHHQAVKTLAPGFKVSATAPDGVIEAIEDPGGRVLPRRAVASRRTSGAPASSVRCSRASSKPAVVGCSVSRRARSLTALA